jgi:hypothetical protein
MAPDSPAMAKRRGHRATSTADRARIEHVFVARLTGFKSADATNIPIPIEGAVAVPFGEIAWSEVCRPLDRRIASA